MLGDIWVPYLWGCLDLDSDAKGVRFGVGRRLFPGQGIYVEERRAGVAQGGFGGLIYRGVVVGGWVESGRWCSGRVKWGVW